MNAADVRNRLRLCGYDSLRRRLAGDGEAPLSESDVLFRARYGCYLLLGFEWEQAFQLALSADATVDTAARLVERGCPREIALRILL